MKKIILILIFITVSINYSFAEDVIWNLKDENFWTELESENSKIKKEYEEQLNAQIELNTHTQPIEIDLIEAIENGIQNSSSYKIAKYQREYSDWEFRNKLSEFLPDIAYSFNLSDLKGEFLVGGILPRKVHETVYSSTFTANWEFFNAKKIFDSVRLKNQQKSKKHTENYTRDDLILKISNAYYELIQRQFEIEIYYCSLIEAQEQLKLNQAKYDVGLGTRFDILRAQAEVEDANANLQNAFFLYKSSQTNLANISGYPVFADIRPKDKIIHKLDLIEYDKTPEVLFSEALLLREDIKAKKRSIKALKAQKNSNVSDLIPKVSLSWEHARVGTLSMGGRDNDTIGFTITAPFGKNLGINSITKYKMDNANYMIAVTELEKLETDIQKKIQDNYYGINTKKDIINAKNKQVISSNEGFKQALERMKIGEATYLDVIEANRLKTQSRIELISSIVNYNKTQLSQLFETGKMNLLEIKLKYEEAKKNLNK